LPYDEKMKLTPGEISTIAGAAIHFAAQAGCIEAFTTQIAEDAPGVTTGQVMRLLSAAHDFIAPECDKPIGEPIEIIQTPPS